MSKCSGIGIYGFDCVQSMLLFSECVVFFRVSVHDGEDFGRGARREFRVQLREFFHSLLSFLLLPLLPWSQGRHHIGIHWGDDWMRDWGDRSLHIAKKLSASS